MVGDEGRILAQVSCTTSTSVECTFKKKISHFINRPNVHNGLTTNSVNVCTKTRTDVTSDETKRPPFVTAVTRGRFLPSKFDLLVEKSLFTFSSRPKPFPNRPRGVHDYFNVMWDPHVVRGTTATTSRSFVNNEFGPKVQESSTPGELPVRKKRSSNLLKTRISQNTSSRLSPSAVDGRVHNVVQTECYLEEISGETEESDASVQTDFESFPSPNEFRTGTGTTIPMKYGVDVATEVIPGELFDFEAEIHQFLESFISKVLEQAMYETIEEEEIAALREQRNYFQEQRIQEERELRKLMEQKESISAEKERLKRHLELEKVDLEKLLQSKQGNSGVTSGTTAYTTSYLLELLPSVLNSLRQEGFLSDNVEDESFSGFPQWDRSTVEVDVHESESGTGFIDSGSRRPSSTITTNNELTDETMSNLVINNLKDSHETEEDEKREQLPKNE